MSLSAVVRTGDELANSSNERPRMSWFRGGLNKLVSPAPMKDFQDFDEYWTRRSKFDSPMNRWIAAADVIEDGASVLDVGCGRGEFLHYLRSRRPNAHLVGADFS